jgi:hypothetical protein
MSTKTKILSFQPFSILGNGGGSRIIRRLTEGKDSELHYISLVSVPNVKNADNETIYALFPSQRKWMRSFIRNFFIFLRYSFLFKYNARKIQKIANEMDFEILHFMDHGNYSNVLLETAKQKKAKIWVSFHDHFSTTGSSFALTQSLWNLSDRRIVISEELGQEYSKLFGVKEFLIITDGLKPDEITMAKSQINSDEMKIYFGGLLHLDYYELFESFCSALEFYSIQNNKKVSLILRGTQHLSFLNDSKLKIEYRPFSIDNKVLKDDLDEADILYLPIKFNDYDFYKFSFSTKMIGYLGASGNIFYHGPSDSAAARFLIDNNCAVICDSLEQNQIINSINEVLTTMNYSENAKKIAMERFKLDTMQELFFKQ